MQQSIASQYSRSLRDHAWDL